MSANIELLKYINENAIMGAQSTNTLIKSLANRDNKIKEAVENILKEYESFASKSEEKLKALNEGTKKPSVMTNVSANMGIKIEVAKDNSDSRIADMLIKGLTMGSIEMEKKIEAFDKSAKDCELDLAKDFKKFQDDSIEKLKKFL